MVFVSSCENDTRDSDDRFAVIRPKGVSREEFASGKAM
jgi:hypothetical protein